MTMSLEKRGILVEGDGTAGMENSANGCLRWRQPNIITALI